MKINPTRSRLMSYIAIRRGAGCTLSSSNEQGRRLHLPGPTLVQIVRLSLFSLSSLTDHSVPPLSRQQSPIASASSGARYLNRDPATRLTCVHPTPLSAVSTEQAESASPMKLSDSATDLLTLATEGSHGVMKPKSEWQVCCLVTPFNSAYADKNRKTARARSAPSPTVPPSSPPTLDSTSCPPAAITADCAVSLSVPPTRHDAFPLPAFLTVFDESLVSESATLASRLYSHPQLSMMTSLVPDPSLVESVPSYLLPLPDPTPSSPQRKTPSISSGLCPPPCFRRPLMKSPTISLLSNHGWIPRAFFRYTLLLPDHPVLCPISLLPLLVSSDRPSPKDGWPVNRVFSDTKARWNDEKVNSILSGSPWAPRTFHPELALDEIVLSDELPTNNLPATSLLKNELPTGPASSSHLLQKLQFAIHTSLIPCLYYSLATIDRSMLIKPLVV